MFGRRIHVVVLPLAAMLLGVSAGCVGPTQPVTTCWQKLGIPQTFLGLRDHFSNRSGNFPQCERKPPLLRIADPANLESPNAAIQAAAKVKAEEDLAPQKIKALKYLAEIGCGCYDEDGKVKDAILAGLSDCTPAVRMAAIQLVEATVGMCDDVDLAAERRHCLHCGGHGCQLCASERHERRKNDKELKKLQKKHEHHHHLAHLKNLLCGHCHGAGCDMCQCCECNSAGCCGKEVQEKLADMAYGVDDLGCFKEPVAAIREAAAAVLELCPCIPEPLPEPEPEDDGNDDVPEGGEAIPQPTPEGVPSDVDTTRGAPADQTNAPASNATTRAPLGLPTASMVDATHNAAYRGVPIVDSYPVSPQTPLSSAQPYQSDVYMANGNAIPVAPPAAGADMVVGAIEAMDPSGRQVVLVFTNELLIPPGEMLLVKMGDGEAQCRVMQSVPGRLAAEILGHDFSRGPTAGEMIQFGVLAQ